MSRSARSISLAAALACVVAGVALAIAVHAGASRMPGADRGTVAPLTVLADTAGAFVPARLAPVAPVVSGVSPLRSTPASPVDGLWDPSASLAAGATAVTYLVAARSPRRGPFLVRGPGPPRGPPAPARP